MHGFLKRILAPTGTGPEFEKVAAIVAEIIGHLSAGRADFTYSSFPSKNQAIATFMSLEGRIREHDTSALYELRTYFLPTGDLQEIAISSGWSRKYLKLASNFEKAAGLGA
ncbi:MAG: hypothetical protein U0P46_03465 [Holophagaceae bacterium]